MSVQHLLGVHVDFVNIGTLLAVDLDADHQVILQGCDLVVLERFSLHHMTPVTSRVANADQYRFVLGPSARPSIIAPRKPVDRIVGVLQKVR